MAPASQHIDQSTVPVYVAQLAVQFIGILIPLNLDGIMQIYNTIVISCFLCRLPISSAVWMTGASTLKRPSS